MAPKTKAKKGDEKESKVEAKAKGGKAAKEETLKADAPEASGDDATALVDPDELEEAEETAAAASSGQNSNAAALAAASGPGEMSASFKNFRHHPDMENFYRFIYENDLRHEALAIVDEIMVEKANRRQQQKTGKSAH